MRLFTTIMMCLFMLSTSYLYSNNIIETTTEETDEETWSIEQLQDYFHKKLLKFKQKHINAKLIPNTLDIEILLTEQAQQLAIAQILLRDLFFCVVK